MKMNFKFLISFLILGLFLFNTGFSQTFPNFKFSASSEDGTLETIIIDNKSPLSDQYLMDFSKKGWTEEDAKRIVDFYNKKSDLFSMDIDSANKRIILKLNTTSITTTEWRPDNWNFYFKSIL